MVALGNLQYFLNEPKWIFVAIFGALNGILLIYTYRGFSDSLDNVKSVVVSGDSFEKTREKSLGRLTSRIIWVVVIFWLTLNFLESPQTMRWWLFYNNPQLVTFILH